MLPALNPSPNESCKPAFSLSSATVYGIARPRPLQRRKAFCNSCPAIRGYSRTSIFSWERSTEASRRFRSLRPRSKRRSGMPTANFATSIRAAPIRGSNSLRQSATPKAMCGITTWSSSVRVRAPMVNLRRRSSESRRQRLRFIAVPILAHGASVCMLTPVTRSNQPHAFAAKSRRYLLRCRRVASACTCVIPRTWWSRGAFCSTIISV